MKFKSVLFFLLLSAGSFAQVTTPDPAETKPVEKKKAWYDVFSVKGYLQMRYNRLAETNPDLHCESCDRSWGDNQSFFIRRARLTMSGDIHPRVYAYLQFDFATSSGTVQNYMNVRDAYFDYAFDDKKVYRLRVGVSKVHYGFDNLQSSSVRLALDRSDALNSGAPNERDLGVFFMWAPESVRKLQKDSLTHDGLKGSGDYGVFSIGCYAGQSLNRPELNDVLHVAGRLSYPFKVGNQVIEPGISGYAGRYVLMDLTPGVKTTNDKEYDDQRVAVGVAIQPKPFGLQAEWTTGVGPEYNALTDSVETQSLNGAYVTLSYRKMFGKQIVQPYARAQYYHGGKKLERDARSYDVEEFEGGIEWVPFKAVELTAAYVVSHRIMADLADEHYDEKGNLIRIQLQINY